MWPIFRSEKCIVRNKETAGNATQYIQRHDENNVFMIILVHYKPP